MTKSIDITMPSLGADMTEGTLVEWQVKPGDTLKKGDIIALLETSKGLIDMEVYQQGVVTELLLEPVVTVPVGTAMAKMEVEGEVVQPATSVPEAPQPAEPIAAQTPSVTAPPVSLQPLSPQPERKAAEPPRVSTRQGVLASPVVRKLAAEQQLELSQLVGSGPGGAILLRDMASKQPQAKAASAADAAQTMRAAIAAAMEKSKREIPHYYLSLDVDITRAQSWLTAFNAERGPEERILLLALILKAIAQSLHQYPTLNGYYQQQQFAPSNAVHIGNVISLREGGLVVPAIHDVEQLSVEDIMVKLRDISERSRRGVLRSSELMDATITVTNMGERGSDLVLGVIYPPQVAIIGIGKTRKGMLVKEDQPLVADLLTVTLAADHRVSDGMIGAKFLNALANKLQKPEKL